MKKRLDVTKSVMEKVTRYERERSNGWVLRFRILMGGFLGFMVLVLWRIWQQLQESNSLDLLGLFWEDAEIVQEFWRDTVSIFIQELPQGTLFMAGLVLLSILGVFWLTRKKRKIVYRRLTELAKKKHT